MTTSTLLSALSADDDWYDRGSCVQVEADVYFARQGELSHSRREEQAKAVCGSCPVLAQCLQWTLSVGDLTGVWAGGTTTAERLAVQRVYDIAS